MNKKAVVGISGGVDSAVAAVLLKNSGYEVIGVTFVFTEDFDAKDAIKTCEKLGIEHHIVDYKKVFKEKVINKFIEDYKKGITPNPCVLCNRYVKLKFLYDEMIKLNCDYMATGHYAKVTNGKLYKSSDLNKDQTYFLCEMKKEQLDKILFPLEGISKDITRKIAIEYNLEIADKKDSTDVCFINSSFKEYIKKEIIGNNGPVINVLTNEVIGTHNGLFNYTIGQRRGLNIGGMLDRMFVVKKDIDKNILYVTIGDDNEFLYSSKCILENVNVFNNEKINECTAKFRYRQNEEEVYLEWLDDNKVLVKFKNKIKSVTPGQVCAFYSGDECLGGGIIKEVIK